MGSSNGFEVHTEYGLPDPKGAATEGHMLPLIKYDRMLGWTYDYLEEARMSQIEAVLTIRDNATSPEVRSACSQLLSALLQ